jgi:predicted regulator of Ras-like GTPase activity (Roadblock/LC7/MglB family)
VQPTEALTDLKQISVQIVHALLTDRDGALVASTLDAQPAAERLAMLSRELWQAAEEARAELGRDELVQLEAATAEGSVFLTRDDRHGIVATTGRDPTVGLVFYDLKACLRSLAQENGRAAAVADRPTAPEAPEEGSPDAAA